MDKEYKIVENITLICYSISLILVCITKFVPFIFFTLLTYPISLKLLKKLKGEKTMGFFGKLFGKKDDVEEVAVESAAKSTEKT